MDRRIELMSVLDVQLPAQPRDAATRLPVFVAGWISQRLRPLDRRPARSEAMRPWIRIQPGINLRLSG